MKGKIAQFARILALCKRCLNSPLYIISSTVLANIVSLITSLCKLLGETVFDSLNKSWTGGRYDITMLYNPGKKVSPQIHSFLDGNLSSEQIFLS